MFVFFVCFPFPCICLSNSPSFVVFGYISRTFSALRVPISGSPAIGMCVLRDFLGLNAFKTLFLLRGAAAWSVRQRCLKHNAHFPRSWWKFHDWPHTGVFQSHHAVSFLSPSGWLVKPNPSPLISCSDSEQKAKSIFKKFISSLPEVSILYYTILWVIL